MIDELMGTELMGTDLFFLWQILRQNERVHFRAEILEKQAKKVYTKMYTKLLTR